MTIGKITLDLKNLKGFYDPEELEIVNVYFGNTKDLNAIKELIPIITDWELTLYTTEDFMYDHIYKYSDFHPITIEGFEEFKKHKVIGTDSNDLYNYYANFDYINGQCIDPKTNIKIRKIIPCLIHLDENIMTYYIFRWKYYDEHNFEIED